MADHRRGYPQLGTGVRGGGVTTRWVVVGSVRNRLRRFALRFINSHRDANGVFRTAFREIVALTTSSNRVRHIVSSQDDAVAGFLGR